MLNEMKNNVYFVVKASAQSVCSLPSSGQLNNC